MDVARSVSLESLSNSIGSISGTAGEDVFVNNNANLTIGAAGLSSSTGEIDISADVNANNASLTVLGALSGALITLAAFGISGGGAITADSRLDLGAHSNSIVLTGVITTSGQPGIASVMVNGTGGVSLTNANNVFSSIETQGIAGNTTIVHKGDLTIYDFNANSRTASFTTNSGGSITVAGRLEGSRITLDSAGALAINGRIEAIGGGGGVVGSLNLLAQGPITQANSSAGITVTDSSNAALRAVTSSGGISLAPTGSGANDVNTIRNTFTGSLGTFAASAGSGDIAFKAAAGFNIGTVGATSGITASGAGAAVSLQTTSGAITQSQAIVAPTLNVTTAGSNVTLTHASNNVAALGTVSLGAGKFTFSDAAASGLSVGPVTALGGVTISNSGTITTTAAITANAEIALTSNGGNLTISDTLTSNGGVIALAAAANFALTIAAPVLAGNGNIFLAADNMSIAGAGTVQTIGGTINIAPVTAGRVVTLGVAPTPAGLVIDNLNAFIGMSALNVGKTRSGATTAGDIQIGQSAFNTAEVNLFTTSGVTQVSPIVFIGPTGDGTLNITAVDTVDLRLGIAMARVTGSISGSGHFIAFSGTSTPTSNLDVGAITTNGGEIVVANPYGTLNVVGALTSNGGNIFASSIGALTLGANVDAGVGSIGLLSNASINQTGGVLIGTNLLALSGGGIALASGTLPGTANQISGNVILNAGATGDISFTNASGFQLGGFSGITYASLGQTLTPDPVASAALSTAGTATLIAGGDITQASGSADKVSAGTLTVAHIISGGDLSVTLDNFDNTVANLGTVAIGQGVFVLNNTGDLTITGAATAGGGYSVETTGSLIQSAAANIDTSSAGGDISLIAGCSCSGGSLTLNADLNAGPAGIVNLEAGDDLNQVAGTIAGVDIFLRAGRDLTLNSNINAGLTGFVTLFAGGAVMQPGGGIVADGVTVSALTASLDSPTNNFARIEGGTDGDFIATTLGSLTIDTSVDSLNGSVTLKASQDIVVDNGAISGAVVSLTAGQDVRVSGTGCGCSGIFSGVLALNATRDIVIDNLVFAVTAATLVAGRDLTFESNAVIGSVGSGDAIVLSTVRSFINNAGASVLDTSGGSGRWLIYSDNPAANTSGGLDSGNAPIWSTSYPTPIAANGNRYVFAVADPSPPQPPTPSSNNNPSQVGPPNNNPANPGVNIAFQNTTGGPTNISFTPPPRIASSGPGTDVSPASLPDGAALATNNGMSFLPVSMYDANQYSQFTLPGYADQAGLSAIFTMIARGVDREHAADAFIDGFWNGTGPAWTPPQSFAGKVTFSDGLGNTVVPTGQAGFPIVAGSTDFAAMLKSGPVMIGAGGNPPHWLLATQMTADGKGIVANDPATGKQVLLAYDPATKTVGGVTGVFDTSSSKFVSFAEVSAGTPALAGLQSFAPTNFLAVSTK